MFSVIYVLFSLVSGLFKYSSPVDLFSLNANFLSFF